MLNAMGMHKVVIVPSHMMGKKEVTDDSGTKRPKFFGAFGLSASGLFDMQDPRACSISEVGWKYFQFFRKLYF